MVVRSAPPPPPAQAAPAPHSHSAATAPARRETIEDPNDVRIMSPPLPSGLAELPSPAGGLCLILAQMQRIVLVNEKIV